MRIERKTQRLKYRDHGLLLQSILLSRNDSLALSRAIALQNSTPTRYTPLKTHTHTHTHTRTDARPYRWR